MVMIPLFSLTYTLLLLLKFHCLTFGSVIGDIISSDCRPGTDQNSWPRGENIPRWENFHRYRGFKEEKKLSHCTKPYTGKLSDESLIRQRKMFEYQRRTRREFDKLFKDQFEIINNSLIKKNNSQEMINKYVIFNNHPRQPHKQSGCRRLGLTHQLMNFQCEVNIALYLNRILLSYPLFQDDSFTKCQNNSKLSFYSKFLNISNLPIRESYSPYPLQNVTFTFTLDPQTLESPKASQAEYINLVRSPKDRQTMSCVEYSWCSYLPKKLNLPWSEHVLKRTQQRLVDMPAPSLSSSSSSSPSLSMLINKYHGVYDAVHIRGGDKLKARDNLVGVPTLSAQDISTHIKAILNTVENMEPSKQKQKDRLRSLLLIATDSIQLVDLPSLVDYFEVFILSSLTLSSPQSSSPSSSTPISSNCSLFVDLAVEMRILERSRHLIISEHSNIGRVITLNRIREHIQHQAITTETRPSTLKAEAYIVRYLYSLEHWRLLNSDIDVGEWELAVKRNDEAAVAVLLENQTQHTVTHLHKFSQ